MNILDQYNSSNPINQHLVDLFKDEWSSKLPELADEKIISGNSDLFEDMRITMLNDKCEVKGKNILELGPLEAGHTYMLHQMGANSITCIESNTRAILKCLIVKELYSLKNANFHLGDALEFMKNTSIKYDICVASGILYHSTSPAEFIESCTKVSDKVFIWTHFYDEDSIHNYEALFGKFSATHSMTYKGLEFRARQFEYLTSLEWSGFCGGSAPYSLWIEKKDMFQIFKMNGFDKIHVFFEDRTHPLGPNICFIAER